MNLQLCTSGLVVFGLAFLAFFILSILKLSSTMDARDKLRWQFKTRKDIEKAIDNNYIAPEAAKNLILRPELGVKPDDHFEETRPTTDSTVWGNRTKSQRGWEAAVVIMLVVVGIVLSGLLLMIALTGGFGMMSMLNLTWPGLVLALAGGIIILMLVIGFIRFSVNVFKTAWQMMKYP